MARIRSRPVRRKRRQFRIRKKITGTARTPRLSVFRSARHIYVQAVDDTAGQTLASASTMEKETRDQIKGYAGNAQAASIVGKTIGDKLKKLGIEGAVFDRGGNRYTGRVKALADAARESGLKF